MTMCTQCTVYICIRAINITHSLTKLHSTTKFYGGFILKNGNDSKYACTVYSVYSNMTSQDIASIRNGNTFAPNALANPNLTKK